MKQVFADEAEGMFLGGLAGAATGASLGAMAASSVHPLLTPFGVIGGGAVGLGIGILGGLWLSGTNSTPPPIPRPSQEWYEGKSVV